MALLTSGVSARRMGRPDLATSGGAHAVSRLKLLQPS